MPKADSAAVTILDGKFPVDLKMLLEAGCHFGHQAQRWSPKMKEYIYTERNGVHIFDLVKSGTKLQEAAQYVYDLAKQGKIVLFVGTKRQAQEIVQEEAIAVNAPFITTRWPGGLLTNWEQLKKSIDKLNSMKKDMAEGKYDNYTKKERVLLNREISRLERFFGGVAALKTVPDALFIVDVGKEKGVVNEAVAKKVPVVAMVDTNSDPTPVAFPIPVNDDAVRSIKLVVHFIAEAYREGRSAWQK